MNNTILDVAIGLVFIYLLYSLLATTIKEFIATIFSYRGRMLERGLEQMLDGKNYSFYWWDRIANFFLWLFQWKKLGGEKGARIDSSTFLSKTILNQEPAAGTNTTPKILRWKLNQKADLFAANITNHPIYTRTAENALFAKKPAYLSADNFSNILIDVLGINKTTGANQLPSMSDITSFVKDKLTDNLELQKILNVYIAQANNDVLQFKTLVENWYDSTMNRVSGWYKKQANRILIIIGFFLAAAFNVNTIGIVRKLSVDKNVREAMVKNASAYINEHIGSVHNPKSNKSGQDSIADTITAANPKAKTTGIKTDSTGDTNFAPIRAKLDSIKKLYDSTIGETNTTMGLGWGDFGAKKGGTKPSEPPGFFAKIWFIFIKTFFNPYNLFGFLITAFAISLGAPFWFDLLNRFVNLRSGGVKPAPVNKPDTKKP